MSRFAVFGAFVGAVVAAAVGLCGVAAAQTCYVWHVPYASGTYNSGTAACAADAAGRSSSYTWTVVSATPSGSASASGGNLSCVIDQKSLSGSDFGNVTDTGNPLTGACPAGCTGLPNMDVLDAAAASTGSANGYCVNSCGYTNGAYTMVVGLPGTNSLIGKAVPTGASCGGSAVAATQANCASTGGNTVCVQDSAPAVFPPVTVNNDVIPQPPPVTGCVAYASGGVACVVNMGVVAPGAPSVGGVTDTPVAQATTTAGTVDYFTPAQVAASTNPVGTTNQNSGGNPAGTTNGQGGGLTCTTVGTTTTCNGTVGTCTPSAAGVTPVVTCVAGLGSGGNGASAAGSTDCDAASSASAAGCADGVLPSLTRTDTVASNMQGMWSGVQATPLFTSLSSIGTSVGSGGSCPAAPMTIASFGGKSFDVMTTVCAVFASNLSTLISISDAIWCLLGVLIVMSA